MKKISLFFIAAMSVLLVGCSEDFRDNDFAGEEFNCITKIYEAGIDASTKTAVDAAGKVTWMSGDKITYYTWNGGTIKQCTVGERGEKAELAIELASSSEYIVGVYGGSKISSRTSEGVLIEGAVPEVQSGVFGDHHVAVTMPSELDARRLTFKNVVAYVKFSIARTDVKKVVFKSNDATRLNGNGLIYVRLAPSLTAMYNDSTSGSNFVKINSNGSGTFYLATLPCTLANGFTIDCYDASDNYLCSAVYSNSVQINMNTILNLGTIDSRVQKVYTDLSASDVANCYIVTEAGDYKIKTVKGNSSTSVGTVASAEVLWESFGTSTQPSVGDLVSGVSYEDGYIKFSASDLKGNAVIAAKDAGGNILWSWHIWMTDQPAGQSYYNSAGTMMDRQLGATSTTPGDVRALGLLYQWGRKDPFVGYDGIASSTRAASTITWSTSWETLPVGVSGSSAIDYVIAHPTVLYRTEQTNIDWYATNDTEAADKLWSSSKTVYDPCPAGYRVPSGDENSIWVKAFGSNEEFYSDKDSANKGINFGTSGNAAKKLGNHSVIWYPASGQIGTYKQSGLECICWTSTLSGRYAVTFEYFAMVFPCVYDDWRSYANSVRCQKMKTK